MNSWIFAFPKIFAAGFASVGLMVSSVLPHSAHHVQSVQKLQHTTISAATVTLTPTETPNTPTVTQAVAKITLQKTITTAGKKVSIFLSMPKDGGNIDGIVSGDCQGAIDGTYTGASQYTLHGRGEITCVFGFLSLPANASFTGIIHPDKQTADINYSVTSGSNFSKTGNVTVSYTQ
ncbi:MAG TPA: hypothetical protein VLG12_02745 [Candidatus Saccharimonadales bacterium]|nr:hypothetical protein [Candidatus Saccharimonadales bacterium]